MKIINFGTNRQKIRAEVNDYILLYDNQKFLFILSPVSTYGGLAVQTFVGTSREECIVEAERLNLTDIPKN